MSFEILKKDTKSSARIGRMKTKHGEVNTPVFLPIGTKGTVKSVSNDELIELGAEMILANTYHLWMSPGQEVLKKSNGLHEFMNWKKPIFTDSGGYQLFSLGEKAENRAKEENKELPFNTKITEEGVSFQRGDSGDKMLLTPEKSVEIQNDIGSDIQVVLDEFTGDINNHEKVKGTIERTTRWAKRARSEFKNETGRFQYGVVQGGMFEDLRKQSAEELCRLDFEGYCIGGVAVGGESSNEQYRAVDMSVPYLPEETPKHLLGVGTPDQIIESVARGMDSFDCVIPTREARHGRLYIQNTESKMQNIGYQTIDIRNKKYEADFGSIDNNCDCYCCLNHTRAYVHHLFKNSETLGTRLMTIHNIRFYLSLMEKIKYYIENDKFELLQDKYTMR